MPDNPARLSPESKAGSCPTAPLGPPAADLQLQAEIIANMFAGVALVRTADATMVYANPRFATLFGYAPGELEGKPVAVLNAPGERSPEEVAAAIIARLESDGVWKGEVHNIRKDGTRLWCQANVTTFKHAQYGDVWVVVQLDITARKTAEERLRRSEERLGLVLEATGGGAWDWNIATGEVYFSPYWMASLGYAPGDVSPDVGFWQKLIHPHDAPRVQEALARHFAGKSPTYECVNRLRRKDGTWRWNLDCGRVVERTSRGEPLRMVGTDTDLSQQRWSGLQEFVQICAACRKIKGEGGAWRVIEAHFQERSLVRFSHGLCPDCAQDLYAEYAQGI